jgi:AcrR family transcriptional regulator
VKETMTLGAHNAERLKGLAFRLVRESGLANLSTRSLAEVSGGNTSDMNYHFGSRANLVAQIHDLALAESQALRASVWRDLVETLPPWVGFLDAFLGCLHMRLAASTGLLLLLQELEVEATSGRLPDLSARAMAENQAEARWWSDLAERYGYDAQSAQIWADLALGLAGMLVAEPDAGVRSVWMTLPATRLRDRLQPGTPPLRLQDGTIPVLPDSEVPANDTAAKILDMALLAISQDGPDRLSQRKVAEMAGVSLAAVTYFFPTKRELINAAFLELYRRDAAEMQDLKDCSRVEIDNLLTVSDADRLYSARNLQAAFRTAARDPELKPIADRLRALRGHGSSMLLAKRGGRSDRVDGYLWACVMMGRAWRMRLSSETDMRAMATSAQDILDTIFQV